MNLPSDENEPETLAPQAVSHNHGIALPESSWSILSSLDSAALAPSHPMAPLQHPSSPMSRGNEVIHSCSSPRFHAMSAAPREIIPLDDPALFLAGRRLCSPGNYTPIVAPQPPSKPLAASSRPQRRRRRRPIQRRDTLRFGAPAPRGCGSWPPVRAPTPSTTTGSTGAATGTARAGSDSCGGLERGFGLHWPEGGCAPGEYRWAGPLRALFWSTAASPSNCSTSTPHAAATAAAHAAAAGVPAVARFPARPRRGQFVALARPMHGSGRVSIRS